jgi:RNA polymerase sigma factor (sigma-70 family)
MPFAAVLEQHGPALLRFCFVQAGADRAEDVFQETMLAALRAYDDLRDPGAVRAWLFSIAARKAVDAHRSATRTAVPAGGPELAEDLTLLGDDDPTATAAQDDALWREVAQLPEKQRQAVTLRYMADLKYGEIATAMAISEDAARRNVYEGLRRLRRDLTDQADAASY